ncbi:deoxynucleotide monophosphate kinase, putative [Pseudogulbenkiania sp. NH8B]|uniref:deoxynucleotide monophosphate kinase family protein n=1 Tax=Pseudogulbenkiania sp. (strain NH8B) TaxID=748280 RepID=UPI0002279A75|nr:deoxynucleotide monophosphate kinase [Pseudogulbenkiania sp. NH8B]BAK75783.1 deoxynucleotide monophosphate kinase, putative [Pseudogulbenkiania sp. NH8B]
MSTTILIGLAGPLKSGKDTIADHLVARHGFVKIGFADTIREEVSKAFHLSEDMATILTEQGIKDTPCPFLALARCSNDEFLQYLIESNTEPLSFTAPRSPRWVQQQWGDFRRATMGWDYFIIAALKRIWAHWTAKTPPVGIVVSGVRFAHTAPFPEAEADMIRENNGTMWHICRPGLETASDHGTERGLAAQPDDHLITNDGTIADLLVKTDSLIASSPR